MPVITPLRLRASIRSAWHSLLLSLLCSGPALAQHSDFSLYVFDRGTPVKDIEVLVDGTLVTLTDPRGLATLQLDPGIHTLELRREDSVVLQQQILAVRDEISQWIVDVTGGGSALFEVESSAPVTAAIPAAGAATTETVTSGFIEGRLTSAGDGSPVAGARIFITGVAAEIRSDGNGRFRSEAPSGARSLSVLHRGFNSLTQDAIEVPPDGSVTLELVLTPAGAELPEFVVIAPFISGSLASVLEERRQDAAVGNILAAEQISKAGDSDAASALRRVTGLTLVGGKYIYVRGLGERYSSTLLNGANVPSPNPVRRVVPLDLFPSGVIDSIAVRKGFTPDLPADFGGGTVELRTRAVPEEGFFSTEFEIGYRDGTTGEPGLRYEGGGRDWSGYDDGTRAQPDLLQAAGANGTRIREFNRFTGEGYTPEELEAIGESLPVNYRIEEQDIDPKWGVTLTGGNRFDFGTGNRVGFLAALDYGDDWATTTQRRTDWVVSGDQLVSENDYTYFVTDREIGLSGFFTTGLELGDNHRIDYNWILLRQTNDKTQRQSGFNKDAEGGDVQFTLLEWIERQLLANQLVGEHVVPRWRNLEIHWDVTVSAAETDEPDTREYRYDPDSLTPETDDLIFSLRNDGNQRRWAGLSDDSDTWNLGIKQPLRFWRNLDLSVAGGLSGVEKDRFSSVRRFAFQSRGPLSGSLDLRRNPSPDDIIFAGTIAPNGWQIGESTIATDTYTAEQQIDAWYVAGDLLYGEWLRLAGGVRSERSNQSVTTFDIFDPGRNPVVSTLSTDDLFPSVTATLMFGNQQIRAGYGETINRPDFKELSPSLFKDPTLDRLVIGNPDLQPAFLTHYDLRWDWYFEPGNFVSLGAFYKEFENPIETVILSGAAQITTFNNAEAAENFGIEFELYTDLGWLGRWWGEPAFWEQFYLNINYAWIDSEITLSESNASVQTSNSRPLQGQSPYVWNFQVGYDDPDRGIHAALLYNVFGERIVDVGTNGAPDLYEEPRPQLDIVYSQRIRDNWKLKFKARNLLDPDVEITQGNRTRIRFGGGREYTLALEWTY